MQSSSKHAPGLARSNFLPYPTYLGTPLAQLKLMGAMASRHQADHPCVIRLPKMAGRGWWHPSYTLAWTGQHDCSILKRDGGFLHTQMLSATSLHLSCQG